MSERARAHTSHHHYHHYHTHTHTWGGVKGSQVCNHALPFVCMRATPMRAGLLGNQVLPPQATQRAVLPRRVRRRRSASVGSRPDTCAPTFRFALTRVHQRFALPFAKGPTRVHPRFALPFAKGPTRVHQRFTLPFALNAWPAPAQFTFVRLRGGQAKRGACHNGPCVPRCVLLVVLSSRAASPRRLTVRTLPCKRTLTPTQASTLRHTRPEKRYAPFSKCWPACLSNAIINASVPPCIGKDTFARTW